MKKAVMLIAVGVMFTTPAAAKTTVDIDYIGDKVAVKAHSWKKAHVYTYKVKTVYTKGKTKLLTEPKKGAKVAYKVKAGDPITRVAKGKTYSVIRYGKGRKYYFAKNSQLTTKKPQKAKYSASYFRKMGVVKWNGYRWTWYSQRVLAGGGLKIKGRHVDEHGYICDKDDYICLASSTLKHGTVISTPFGKRGKIYDSGCARGTIDTYVDW